MSNYERQQISTACHDFPEDRIFIIGVWSIPEHVRKYGLPAKEEFALSLESECYENLGGGFAAVSGASRRSGSPT